MADGIPIRDLKLYASALRQLPQDESMGLWRFGPENRFSDVELPRSTQELINKVADRYGDEKLTVGDTLAFIDELVSAAGSDGVLTEREFERRFGAHLAGSANSAMRGAFVLGGTALNRGLQVSDGYRFPARVVEDNVEALLREDPDDVIEPFVRDRGRGIGGAMNFARLSPESQVKIAEKAKDASHGQLEKFAEQVSNMMRWQRLTVAPQARQHLIEGLLDGYTGAEAEEAILKLLTGGGAREVLVNMSDERVKELWTSLATDTPSQFLDRGLANALTNEPYRDAERDKLADIFRQASSNAEVAEKLDRVFGDDKPWEQAKKPWEA